MQDIPRQTKKKSSVKYPPQPLKRPKRASITYLGKLDSLPTLVLCTVVGIISLHLLQQSNAEAQPTSTRPTSTYSHRIVSLNVCTDQLLLALANPYQIAALSRFSRHENFSYYAHQAANYRSLRGTIEEVLRIKPDLVIASTYTRPVLKQALARFHIRTELFKPATTIAQGKNDILRLARIVGHENRGKTLVKGVAQAVRTAQRSTRQLIKKIGNPITALQLQRRGFVSGHRTLLNDILQKIGLKNAIIGTGVTSISRIPLEALLKLRPDVLIVDNTTNHHSDQGSALFAHPALAKVVPLNRRIQLPQHLIICSGPSLPTAIRRLSSNLHTIKDALASVN